MIIMILNQKEICCDYCSYTEDFPECDEFLELVKAAKINGWKIERTNNSYDHICPTCVADRDEWEGQC